MSRRAGTNEEIIKRIFGEATEPDARLLLAIASYAVELRFPPQPVAPQPVAPQPRKRGRPKTQAPGPSRTPGAATILGEPE